MAQVYLISDTHFFHLNIAKKRGFETVEEMNDLIIKNWNSAINKNDKVFVLGDCTMEKKEHYNIFGKLNGNKTFILGNHCKEQGPNDLIKYGKVAGMLKYRGFWLTHCPIHPMELRGLKNIHGHIHWNEVKRYGLFKDKRYINVCVDVTDYKPVLFEDLIK